MVAAVTDATGQLASVTAATTITHTTFDCERLAACAAQRTGDDAALMRPRKHSCPDDSHVFSSPGDDARTTTPP